MIAGADERQKELVKGGRRRKRLQVPTNSEHITCAKRFGERGESGRDFYDFNLYVLIYFNVAAASWLSTIAKQVLMLMNSLTATAQRYRIGFPPRPRQAESRLTGKFTFNALEPIADARARPERRF